MLIQNRMIWPPTSPRDLLVVTRFPSALICPPPPPTSHNDSLDGFPASICPSTTTNESSRLVGGSLNFCLPFHYHQRVLATRWWFPQFPSALQWFLGFHLLSSAL